MSSFDDVSVDVHTERAQRAATDGGERGLTLATEHVLSVSDEHVPLEEGTLERSGVASVDGLEGAVSYDTVYAVYQHERLDLHHDDPSRTAKYLENAVNTEGDTVLALLATALRAEFAG